MFKMAPEIYIIVVYFPAEELMLLNCGVGEDSWESLGLQGDPTSPFWRRSALGFLWREWGWSWNSSTLATSCEELTHWKRLWCWEELGAGGEGANRGWDGWIASPTRWTWVWVNSGSWWWTGKPGVLRFMGSQRVGHDWVNELNWTDTFPGNFIFSLIILEGYRRLVGLLWLLHSDIPVALIPLWGCKWRPCEEAFSLVFQEGTGEGTQEAVYQSSLLLDPNLLLPLREF